MPTSFAAFVGHLAEGPVAEPVRVVDADGLAREFGAPETGTRTYRAVEQFFRNGGGEARVVRAAVEGYGDPPPVGAAELIEALDCLDAVDPVNLLAVPDTDGLADPEAAEVIAAAAGCAENRRAFYLVDAPHRDAERDDPRAIAAWLAANESLRHRNAALYSPRPLVPGAAGGTPRAVPASGTLAGIYARNDVTRGVWKAPAGVEATLEGVAGLAHSLTDAESAVLNPLAINALRAFPQAGIVAWGARTLTGASHLGSEWRYVPVRRLALFVEKSVDRGTRFAVFEPNDEPLWAEIRQAVGEFLDGLFRRGAFVGTTPRDAYFVRCDRTTMTADEIERGIVRIQIGFAALQPAEFVILSIEQRAGRPPEET